MNFALKTCLDLDASRQRIWTTLLDFARYEQWNPFMRAISGEPRVGARLRVSVQPPSGAAMTFRPVVVAAEENRHFRWRGSLPIPGLFTGEHYFILEALSPTRTRLFHGEDFSGLLVRFARSGLSGPTRQGFEAMNQALRTRVEAAGA